MTETRLRRPNAYGYVTLLCVGLGLVAVVVGGPAAHRSSALSLFAVAGFVVAVAMSRNGDNEGYPQDEDDDTLSDGTQRRQKVLEGDKGRASGESL